MEWLWNVNGNASFPEWKTSSEKDYSKCFELHPSQLDWTMCPTVSFLPVCLYPSNFSFLSDFVLYLCCLSWFHYTQPCVSFFFFPLSFFHVNFFFFSYRICHVWMNLLSFPLPLTLCLNMLTQLASPSIACPTSPTKAPPQHQHSGTHLETARDRWAFTHTCYIIYILGHIWEKRWVYYIFCCPLWSHAHIPQQALIRI